MKSLYFFLTLIFASNAWAAQQSPQGALEPTPQSPKVDTYDELVHEVRAVRRVSKERVELAVRQEKVREAWEIGKLIDTHVLYHKERADYAKQVLVRLAQDLGMSKTELYYMLQFARDYPIFPSTGKLSWSHYRELLTVNEPEKRKELSERAEREQWSEKRLRLEIKRLKGKNQISASGDLGAQQNEVPLVPIKGRLDTYRIVIARVGPWKGKPALDLGFSNYYNHPSLKLERFKEGDILRGQAPFGGLAPFGGQAREKGDSPQRRGQSPFSAFSDATPADLFTYRGYPFKITDGDTLWVLVDLGFGFATQQHLRLRGIDAPEIESKEGKEAKEFLEKLISKSGGTVLVRTSKSDKYDRYLADLWVGEIYVNQELIRQGLAVRVTD